MHFNLSMLKLIIMTLAVLSLSSCARLKDAFKKSATSPHVWRPIAVASVVALSGQDAKISSWGRKETPLFASQDRAEKRSDQLGDVLEIQGYGSWLVLDLKEKGLQHKSKQFLAMETGVRSSYWTTYAAKRATRRDRPQSQDKLSLPSGHATAGGAWRNVTAHHLGNRAWPLNDLNTGIASLKSWARVEAGKHYPTDVLVGYALGSFFTELTHQLWMSPGSAHSITFLPTSHSLMVTVSY